MRRLFYNVVHVIFLVAAMAIVGHAQRKDGYLYEKVHDQEKHLDHTDQDVKEVDTKTAKAEMENRILAEQAINDIARFRGDVEGWGGAIVFLGGLAGLLKNFTGKGNQTA